jgi:hypothetical protein
MFSRNRVGKRLIALFFLLLMLAALTGTVSAAETKDASPVNAVIGVFVMSLYDLSLTDNSFDAVFWVWLLFPEGTEPPPVSEDSLEIVNAKSFDRMFYFDLVKGGRHWVTMKYNAVLTHNWNMDDFPFDRQFLKIEIEEAEYDATQVQFVPDRIDSNINSEIKIPGWKVERLSIESRLDINETTYGDPVLTSKSVYPETIITIVIKREGTRLLFNLLTAAYVAFILGIMVLFLHPDYIDARKVVLTSSMITIIGNHYIISASLPEISTFTLIDKVMITTFTAICLCAFFSVLTSHYVRTKRMKTAVRINNIARWIIVVVYVILNAIFYIQVLL